MTRSTFAAAFTALALLSVGVAVGCEEKTPAEKAGDRMEKAGDKVGNAAEKAGDKMGDAADKAGDKIKDATN